MKFTKDWLSDHLSTSKSEKQIIEKLNGIGLEVEKVEPVKNELSDFVVAKIIKAKIATEPIIPPANSVLVPANITFP